MALTFDGGADAGQSEQILRTLEERDVSATFFLTGGFIAANPDLVRRIAAAGHEVGNHTWTHPHLTSWDRTRRHDLLPGVDGALLRRELARTAALFEEVTGRRMAPLWRAPFGEINGELLRWAGEAGWSHVGWSRDEAGGTHSLDSLDWVAERSSRRFLTSAQIVSRILSFGGGDRLNGGIVLLHLCTRREDPVTARLGELVDALSSHGYRLVTVSGMMRESGPDPALATLAASSVP